MSQTPTVAKANPFVGKPDGRPDDPLTLRKKIAVLGAVSYLCQFSQFHIYYLVGFLQNRFMPGITHNQFRLYETETGPIGFATWAWLTAENEEKYRTGTHQLGFADWVGGDRLWFIEMLAPFGHEESILRDLRTLFPPGTVAHALRPKLGGGVEELTFT